MAGVIHSKQEHFFPDHTTSPILTLHLGQASLLSFYSPTSSQDGHSTKKDVHFSPCKTESNNRVLHARQRQCVAGLLGSSMISYSLLIRDENQSKQQIWYCFMQSSFRMAPLPNSHQSRTVDFSSLLQCFLMKQSPFVPQFVYRISEPVLTFIYQLPKTKKFLSQVNVLLILQAQTKTFLVRLQMKDFGFYLGMQLGWGSKGRCVNAAMTQLFSSYAMKKRLLILSIFQWKFMSFISAQLYSSLIYLNLRSIYMNLWLRFQSMRVGFQKRFGDWDWLQLKSMVEPCSPSYQSYIAKNYESQG